MKRVFFIEDGNFPIGIPALQQFELYLISSSGAAPVRVGYVTGVQKEDIIINSETVKAVTGIVSIDQQYQQELAENKYYYAINYLFSTTYFTLLNNYVDFNFTASINYFILSLEPNIDSRIQATGVTNVDCSDVSFYTENGQLYAVISGITYLLQQVQE